MSQRFTFRNFAKACAQAAGIYVPLQNFKKSATRFKNKLNCVKVYWPQLKGSKVFYVIPFVLFDREITNFTYDISNTQELISFLSKDFGIPDRVVSTFARELENDLELRNSLETRLSKRKDRNKYARYGRRIGWYCIARMIRPSVIVETGTADGLGTAILARALHRNGQEGYSGILLSFDIHPDTGWLPDRALADSFQLIIGDAKNSMDANLIGKKVDFFLHDSDHSYDHETWELETISKYLSDKAVIVSDNAHASDAMKNFCERRNLPFAFFREQPKQHFYPGGGIGLSRWHK